MTRLARVTLAASIDAAKSGRPLGRAMKIAAKAAEAEAPCVECGGLDSHLDACPVINEGRDTHFYSERSLGGRPW